MNEIVSCHPRVADLRVHAHYAGAQAAELEARAAEAEQQAQTLRQQAADARRRYFGYLVRIDEPMGDTPSDFAHLA